MYQSEVEANSALRRLLNEQRRRLTEQTVALSREVEEGRHRLTLLQTERDGLQSQVRAPAMLTHPWSVPHSQFLARRWQWFGELTDS